MDYLQLVMTKGVLATNSSAAATAVASANIHTGFLTPIRQFSHAA